MADTIKYGIVILAAGNSSRLGRPKQLLKINGVALLEKIIDQATQVPDSIAVVVTGAQRESIDELLGERDVLTAFNAGWATGMGSSITTGVRSLTEAYPALTAIVIAVCDQPYLTTHVFESLIQSYQNGHTGIVAAAYGGTVGTPVLFSADYFPALLELMGQEGAKKIIMQNPADTFQISFPEGMIDIDTQEDYRKLTGQ